MIVRLKVCHFKIRINIVFMGFNSMIVRLKDQWLLKPYTEIIEFQFYDSPIKSRSKRQKTLLILNNLSFNYINKLTNKVVEAQR